GSICTGGACVPTAGCSTDADCAGHNAAPLCQPLRGTCAPTTGADGKPRTDDTPRAALEARFPMLPARCDPQTDWLAHAPGGRNACLLDPIQGADILVHYQNTA